MKNNFIFILLALIIVSAGCNVAYVPNRHNVPLMQEKGDANINISTTNVQGAYALTDKFAVMGNMYFRDNTWDASADTLSDWSYQANRFLAEGALGYYKPMGDNGSFETYAGGGMGSIRFEMKDDDPYGDRLYKANISRFFIQPDIGYKSDYFDFIFSAKFSYLGFNNVDTTNYKPSALVEDNLYKLDKQPFFFFEPAITIRFGYKYIKAYSQAIIAKKLNPERINYRSFGVNVGLEIDISEIIYRM
ncbi:MAG: hypothetical protein R6U19_10640 [Bacteroidales bacterium]